MLLADMIGQENCIIIGRCGNYIFRERKDLVSVFLKGNLQARIAGYPGGAGLSRTEAAEFVEHADDCRVAYHSIIPGLPGEMPDDYDVCLDTVRLGVEKTAQAIESYVEAVL